MDLTDYKARSPQLVEVDQGWVRAFVGDDLPKIGHALEIRAESGERAHAVVQRHAGGRLVDAMLLDAPDWLAVGDEVVATDRQARLPAPMPGRTDLDQLSVAVDPVETTTPFSLPTPAFSDLHTERPPVETGFSALDRLAPLAGHGLNLVLDARRDPDAYDRLVERCQRSLACEARLWLSLEARNRQMPWASHQIETASAPQRRLTGLRVLMSWAAALRDEGRDVFLAAELPPLVSADDTSDVEAALGASIGQVIDQIGSALTSTTDGDVTVLLRLPLFESATGLEHIIETMDLGDVDTQVFVDQQGRFDPYRSTSDAQLSGDAAADQQRLLTTLSRAAAARDKSALLGDVGLEEAERRAIEEADSLRVSLLE